MSEPTLHSLVKALRAVPDFASLDDHVLLSIVGTSANLFWPAGSMIFEKGTPSEALYIILSGEVQIFDLSDGLEIEVVRLQTGASFGELSILLRSTHSKSARAAQDSELMVVPKESFEQLLDSNPPLADYFRRRVAERLPAPSGPPSPPESSDVRALR